MKHIKLFENHKEPLKTRLRLHELGLASESIDLISIAVNWDASRESEVAFTYRDYYDWPQSLEYDRWTEHLDHFEGQIRDWLNWPGLADREVFAQWPQMSDKILPMLLDWLQHENWEILHLTHEGQFYDIKTRKLIGEGSVQQPRWLE